MNLNLIVVATSLFLVSGLAQAADPTPAAGKSLSSSQQRMADCNKEAAGKKGPERRDFMRQCMHGDNAPPGGGRMSQQDRMRDCNKQAGEKALRGPDRKAFMSECLKAK